MCWLKCAAVLVPWCDELTRIVAVVQRRLWEHEERAARLLHVVLLALPLSSLLLKVTRLRKVAIRVAMGLATRLAITTAVLEAVLLKDCRNVGSNKCINKGRSPLLAGKRL